MATTLVNSVFEFKSLETNYEASGSAGAVDVYTDMNGAWATSTNGTLATTSSGPATVSLDLGSVKGTAFEVKYTAGASTATLIPRSATLKVRRIGLYLAGGGTWSTKRTTLNV